MESTCDNRTITSPDTIELMSNLKTSAKDSLCIHRTNSNTSSLKKLKHIKALRSHSPRHYENNCSASRDNSANFSLSEFNASIESMEYLSIPSKMLDAAEELAESIDHGIDKSCLQSASIRYCEVILKLTKRDESDLNCILTNGIVQKSQKDPKILTDRVKFCSLREYDMFPMFGEIFIAYIPKENKLQRGGIVRLVDYYSKQLQTQQKMANNIALSISSFLHIQDVGVQIKSVNLEEYIGQTYETGESDPTYCVLGGNMEEIKRALDSMND